METGNAILNIDLVKLVDHDDAPCFHLQAAESDRWDHFGLGTFLCDVEKGEVEISQKALDKLLEQPNRPGLPGMEFWPDNRLAWGSAAQSFFVPCDCVSVPKEAKAWICSRFVVREAE